MRRQLSIPAVIRLYSYSIALILVLALGCTRYYIQANHFERQLRAVYSKNLGELSDYLTGISNTLTKGIYAGTPAQMSRLSARLWRDSGAAKSALASLPAAEVDLTSAYRFLSQVGDYAMSISSRMAAGEEITEEERASLEGLLSYAQDLTASVYVIEQRVRTGEIIMERDTENAGKMLLQTAVEPQAGVFDEAGKLEGYASLIYDGPFSDHLLQIEPRIIKNAPEVSPAQALNLARRATGNRDLTLVGEEHSTMVSYCFEGEGYAVGVTKRGGHLAYLTSEQQIGGQRIDARRAVELGEAYLSDLGVTGMRPTYYESAEGVCTINFAFVQEKTVCYPDLIKVGVALDDGRVVFVDARGYLVNHHLRKLPDAALSPEQGRASLGRALSEAVYVGPAVIPTEGGGERFCYEYRATGRDGHRLLLYVNALTGEEEQILILIETESGVLTV